MTNREYLATLTPYEFAQWVFQKHPYNLEINSAFEIGSVCISSIDGLTKWLDQEYNKLVRDWFVGD